MEKPVKRSMPYCTRCGHVKACMHKPDEIVRRAWNQETYRRTRKLSAEEEKKIEKRALQLQARGPDEFPFGYYLYLAREEAER